MGFTEKKTFGPEPVHLIRTGNHVPGLTGPSEIGVGPSAVFVYLLCAYPEH